MKPKRAVTMIGWLSAVLLNVGPLLFLAGLLVPHPGSGPNGVLVTGLTLSAIGIASGAVWLIVSRTNDRQR